MTAISIGGADSSLDGWQLEGGSADAYERYLASAFAPWAMQLVLAAGVKEGDRVLDLACGTGIVARQAASVVGPTGAVAGLDVNPDMLRVARLRSSGSTPAIDWHEGGAAKLPFPAASFDAVLCEQALQFFAEPEASLAEARRVLRPDGHAAFSVCRPIAFSPAYVTLADALDRFAGVEAGAIMRSPFSRWSVDDLREPFMRAGFDQVVVRIEAGALRYPSVGEFLRQEAASSPLAGPIAAMPADARQALVRHLEHALADRVDDAGVSCPVESYVVLATSHR